MAPLDPQQRAAVDHDGSPLVVLAGPGSGKTRVLVERMRRLLASGAPPASLLCLTFTRRAAGEMAERLGVPAAAQRGERPRGQQHPTIATFHSLALRILRAESKELEHLPKRFSIYDGAAQARAVRASLEAAQLDVKHHPIPVVLDRLRRARSAEDPEAFPLGPYRAVLRHYLLHLERAGALDFLGLLEAAAGLLWTKAHVRERWRQRFRHVLVDEAQDTSLRQLALLEGLLDEGTDVAVVGDPDQSIYGWRGASPDVMERFLKQRPDSVTLRLEHNYRSSANILEAADALIAPQQHLRKRLIATRDSGEPLLSVCLEDDYREARAIGTILQNLKEDGASLSDAAVLVRAHSQLRAIESLLARWKIPFRTVGAPEFVERREIMDLTAYLRLIDNPRDEDAFWRAIQAPRRGVGPVSSKRLQAIVDEANEEVPWRLQTSLVAAVASRRVTSGFKGRTREGLESFGALMESLTPLASAPAAVALRSIVEALKPLDWLDSLPGGEGQGDRRASVEEFISAADEFDLRYPDDGISGFLSDLALIRDLDEDAEGSRKTARDAVQLMTLHASKGKEFKTVFIAGMEEELLPHQRSLEGLDHDAEHDDVAETEALLEERRLFFVGLTRAKDQVFLTRARSRVRYGLTRPSRTSRFLHELPVDLVEILDPEHLDALAIEKKAPSGSSTGFRPGDEVEHAHYGPGLVVGFMGKSLDARILVHFEAHGVKELYLQHTKLRRP